MPLPAHRLRLAAASFLLFLPLLFFHRSLAGREAFLPADQTALLYPWRTTAGDSATVNSSHPWNVLRFDGITQYYPWRLQAARSYQNGRIPLWNPYQFAAEGGTPLLANSQSAPLYPPNVLFFLAPPDRLWYAFGLSAAIHLLIAATGTYAFLRTVGLHRASACLGAATFTLSAPVVTWLALPTFLAVTCWVPWLLLLIRHSHNAAGSRAGRQAALGAGAVAGTMLLAGHLQMAFYGLLAGFLYALWLGVQGIRQGSVRPASWVAAVTAALLVAVGLSAAQVLPAVELSRVSHRAGGAANMVAYQGYIANALPPRHLVTTLAPDFFGHPNDPEGLYWATNNYAEWALYVGVVPLLLAVFAVALPWRGDQSGRIASERVFLTLLALLTLLLSLGTPANLPLFFLVPGYSQTGNPARSLALFAFAAACLAAFGLEALLKEDTSLEAKRRAALVAVFGPLIVAATGLSLSAQWAAEHLSQVPFAALFQQGLPGLSKAVLLLFLGAVLLFGGPRVPRERRVPAVVLVLLAVIGDLFSWGAYYNPTVAPEQVYPVTPGITYLQQNARDALIAPLNTSWSLSAAPPARAVLPPNSLTVYGLHDLQGYDSLFPGKAKERVRAALGGNDPSPPENGNMVFVKSPEAAVALGARFLILPPEASLGGLAPVYAGRDMTIYENPGGKTIDTGAQRQYAPVSFRLGLYLGLCALSALMASGFSQLMALRQRRR